MNELEPCCSLRAATQRGLSTEAQNRFDDVTTMRAIEWRDCSKALTFGRPSINIAVGYLIVPRIPTFDHPRR